MTQRLIGPLLAVFVVFPNDGAALNKCVDAKGKVTYTDKPCTGIGRRAGMDVKGMTYSSQEVTNANEAYAHSLAGERRQREAEYAKDRAASDAHARSQAINREYDVKAEQAQRQYGKLGKGHALRAADVQASIEAERQGALAAAGVAPDADTVSRRFDRVAKQSQDAYARQGKGFAIRGAAAQANIESQRQAALAASGQPSDAAAINKRFDELSAQTRAAHQQTGKGFTPRIPEAQRGIEAQRENALAGSPDALIIRPAPRIAAGPQPQPQVIDPVSGTVFTNAAGGIVDPRNGTFYQSVVGGYVNSKTGKFVPTN